MRVKIAYTVKLEEVEEEVSEIMSRAANELDSSYQKIVDIQSDLDARAGDISNHLKELDTIRRKMMLADQVLEDCMSILQGYRQTLKQLQEKEE